MNTTVLLQKLTEIERSIGVETNATIRNQVLDLQDFVLETQKQTLENLRKQPKGFGLEPFPSASFAA
jgi:hypothetical protein